jgi:hypothetical protein
MTRYSFLLLLWGVFVVVYFLGGVIYARSKKKWLRKKADFLVIGMTPKNQLRELWCVIFGHSWNTYGIVTAGDDNHPIEEYNVCSVCHLENHKRCPEKVEGYAEKVTDVSVSNTIE